MNIQRIFGCLMALLLAQSTIQAGSQHKNSLLVLEAGQNRSNDPIVYEGPATLFPHIDELAYNPKYSYTQNLLENKIKNIP